MHRKHPLSSRAQPKRALYYADANGTERWASVPGVWSHRIFQRYAAGLPTSLSCIASVDQRRLTEETGCGDSVRLRSLERPPPRDVPWSHRTPGRYNYRYRARRRLSARSAPFLTPATEYTVSIKYAQATRAQGALLCRAINHGPTWSEIRWSVCALMHRIVRGKRKLLGGSGAPVPHCLLKHQRIRSKGRCHHT